MKQGRKYCGVAFSKRLVSAFGHFIFSLTFTERTNIHVLCAIEIFMQRPLIPALSHMDWELPNSRI